MLPFEDRHSRQRRLAEVGPKGQECIARSHARAPAYAGGEVAREYLLRAGFRAVVSDPSAPAPRFPFERHFDHEASRAVARGAWAALDEIRRQLGMSPGIEVDS